MKILNGVMLLFFGLWGAGLLSAQQVLPALTPPAVQKPSWVWGIRPLRVRGRVDPSLLLGIPATIRAALNFQGEHIFSNQERDRLRQKALDEALKAEKQKLTQVHNARDLLLFKPTATESSLFEAQKNIDQTKSRIAFYESLSKNDVVMNGEAKIEFKEGRLGVLLDESSSGTVDFMTSQGLDFLVTGSVSILSDYLVVELEGWYLDGSRGFYWRDVFDPKELSDRLVLGLDQLKEVIIGKPWASLTIVTQPSDTDIYIDGTFMGRGIFEAEYFDPGNYSLRLTRLGYESLTEPLVVTRFQNNRVEKTLEALSEETRFILSEPEGASVYLSSVWMGVTPLELPPVYEKALLEFRLEGYDLLKFPLVPGLEDLSVLLTPVGPRETVLEAKDRFYQSMAFFGVSLTATILLSSMEPVFANSYYQYALAYQGGDSSVLDRLNVTYTLQQTAQNGGWVGAGVSAGFFVYMMYELFNYIAVSENQVF